MDGWERTFRRCSSWGREICLVQSTIGVPIVDCPQVLGCDTPNSTLSVLSVQASERTEGIVGLGIPDDEQGEVRFVLWCGSLRYACQLPAWQVDICLVKHVVTETVHYVKVLAAIYPACSINMSRSLLLGVNIRNTSFTLGAQCAEDTGSTHTT